MWVQCQLGHWVPLTELIDHMYERHGVSGEYERWPDGALVVYDDTLTPADFDDRDGDL